MTDTPKDFALHIYIKQAESEEDIALAAEEVTRLIRQGFTSGSDVNLAWDLEEDE